jgi:hypothetical protein
MTSKPNQPYLGLYNLQLARPRKIEYPPAAYRQLGKPNWDQFERIGDYYNRYPGAYGELEKIHLGQDPNI